MTAEQIFERAIQRQEAIRHNKSMAAATFLACEIPGINSICPGTSAEWHGFKVQRRRVDELDNIYIKRA